MRRGSRWGVEGRVRGGGKKYSTVCLWIFLELFVMIKKLIFFSFDNDHIFKKLSVYFSLLILKSELSIWIYIKTINVYIKTIKL